MKIMSFNKLYSSTIGERLGGPEILRKLVLYVQMFLRVWQTHLLKYPRNWSQPLVLIVRKFMFFAGHSLKRSSRIRNMLTEMPTSIQIFWCKKYITLSFRHVWQSISFSYAIFNPVKPKHIFIQLFPKLNPSNPCHGNSVPQPSFIHYKVSTPLM